MLTGEMGLATTSLNINVFVEQPTTKIVVVTIAIGGAQAKGPNNRLASSSSSLWLLFSYFVLNKLQNSRGKVGAMGRVAPCFW
jgi:hypothetical protein